MASYQMKTPSRTSTSTVGVDRNAITDRNRDTESLYPINWHSQSGKIGS